MTTHDTPEAVYASRHGDDCECGCHDAEARAYESGQNFALLHARLVHGCDHGLPVPTTRDTPEAVAALAEALHVEAMPYSDHKSETPAHREKHLIEAQHALAALDAAGFAVVNEERLAIALHYAMCDVSHHDGGPMGHNCHNWPKYPSIARTTMRALAGGR